MKQWFFSEGAELVLIGCQRKSSLLFGFLVAVLYVLESSFNMNANETVYSQ
jgi:hypothetical protein